MMTAMKINTTFWKDKRVLITGHTGFKGSWLTALLNGLGAETHGLALDPDANRPSLYALGVKPSHTDKKVDIRDAMAVERVILDIQPEIVFHLAAQALVLPSYEDPIGTFATNVMGTVNVAMAALKNTKLKVFVNITSDKCYENREWPWPYRENDPMGGFDPYSASKGCAELAAASLRRSFFHEKGIALPSVRAGNVIGGGDWAAYRIVPDLIEAFARNETAIIRSPRAIRPWQHVLEPLRAYIMIAQAAWSDLNFSKGWNIGPDHDAARPVLELAQKAAEIWGPGAKIRVDEPANKKHEATYLKLDSALIRQEIGWRPLLNFDEALALTVEWYKAHNSGFSPTELTRGQILKFLNSDANAVK
jgi:CDP-glucose 4,6-dehydratase